jgi:hypothetical protein
VIRLAPNVNHVLWVLPLLQILLVVNNAQKTTTHRQQVLSVWNALKTQLQMKIANIANQIFISLKLTIKTNNWSIILAFSQLMWLRNQIPSLTIWTIDYVLLKEPIALMGSLDQFWTLMKALLISDSIVNSIILQQIKAISHKSVRLNLS